MNEDTEAARAKFVAMTGIKPLRFRAMSGSMKEYWSVHVSLTDDVQAFRDQFHTPQGQKSFKGVPVEFLGVFSDLGTATMNVPRRIFSQTAQ